jgi:hypothetical protein
MHAWNRTSGWFALFLAGVAPAGIQANTYKPIPRSAVLLPRSERFIALDAWNSAALYEIGDGQVVYRFPAKERIDHFAATADESRLLVACGDGSLGLWNLETGANVWWQTSKISGLRDPHDASFARDGKSCIVCNERDNAVIFESDTGRRIGVVSFPPGQTDIMSAALSPDGSSGLLVDLWQRVFLFDVATGRMTNTGISGAWPIRYSADGKHAAFRSRNSGTREALRVVTLDDTLEWRDVGKFGQIGLIKPSNDGGFQIRARTEEDEQGKTADVAVKYSPHAHELKELALGIPVEHLRDENRTDFSDETLVGVETSYNLITLVIDLKENRLLLKIDNHENREPNHAFWIFDDLLDVHWSWWAIAGGGVVVLMAVWTFWRLGRRTSRARLSVG